MSSRFDVEYLLSAGSVANILMLSQSNRILEQTEKIGRGYGFMIFCFYLGFSVLLHLLHFFHD